MQPLVNFLVSSTAAARKTKSDPVSLLLREEASKDDKEYVTGRAYDLLRFMTPNDNRLGSVPSWVAEDLHVKNLSLDHFENFSRICKFFASKEFDGFWHDAFMKIAFKNENNAKLVNGSIEFWFGLLNSMAHAQDRLAQQHIASMDELACAFSNLFGILPVFAQALNTDVVARTVRNVAIMRQSDSAFALAATVAPIYTKGPNKDASGNRQYAQHPDLRLNDKMLQLFARNHKDSDTGERRVNVCLFFAILLEAVPSTREIMPGSSSTQRALRITEYRETHTNDTDTKAKPFKLA